mgnify:CR=1 FL=1
MGKIFEMCNTLYVKFINIFCINFRKHFIKTSEVIKYIENMYDIKLMDYQKEFVKHVIRLGHKAPFGTSLYV